MMSRLILLALLAALPLVAIASRPPVETPGDPAQVLEHLPRGYAALVPLPVSSPPSLDRIQQLLATAGRTGDARLAARADAQLARFPASDNSSRLLRLRAYSAQHRHDFTTARALLDQLIAADPRDGDARLTRAQIEIVIGQLDRARGDCAGLVFGVDSGRGMLCIAALSLRRQDYPAAQLMLDRWLEAARPGDESLLYALVMRGELASRAKQPDADRWFVRALALAPDDVRTLAAYSRHLRSQGRAADAFKLLANAPASDGISLERALAAHSLRLPEAAALADAQGRRYALAHELGSQPEMRDEAEYLLTLRGDANGALRLALKNFEQQRDVEDVSILRRAASAAGKPEALAPLAAWTRAQKIGADDRTASP